MRRRLLSVGRGVGADDGATVGIGEGAAVGTSVGIDEEELTVDCIAAHLLQNEARMLAAISASTKTSARSC